MKKLPLPFSLTSATIVSAILLFAVAANTTFSAENKSGTMNHNAMDTHAMDIKKMQTSMNEHYSKPSKDQLRSQLTELQYEVTQEEGTERPFKNEYWDNHEDGIYVDIVSGEPLFSSTDKFDSGTGWPSFTKPIEDNALTRREDRKLWTTRVEVRSKFANSHLGHVFDDGPKPTGLRYCINSAALKFIPKNKLEQAGYGQFLPLFNK